VDLQKVVEAIPDLAFIELDVTGFVRGWSPAATRLLGFSADEVIGRSMIDLASKIKETAETSALELAAREGRAETFGWTIRKDGSRFWANEVTRPIRDPKGQTTGFARVVRDMTAWEVAAVEREQVVNLSADLIGIAGFDGYFKRVNPSFTRVLGYTEAELLAKPYVDFIHPDDLSATQNEASSIAAGLYDVTRSFQNRYRCKDGGYRWLEWRTRPNVSQEIIYFVARDVTAQKEVSEKLADYSHELERSNGELQQFAYVASHDLQEPLRAVAGCVQMLGERNAGKLDERSKELMGYAVDGAKRMQTLINDLLSYSRVGSKGINKSWMDPKAAVDKAIRQLQTSLDECHAAVSIDPLPRVSADAVQLTQLFQNLIGNAIKFHDGKPPEVRISARQEPGETIFSVRDNGIGIAPEYHDRLFRVFQRLHSRVQYAGTGIGLAICKKIVERHGGRIWVESQTGQGATFLFSIPKEKDDEAQHHAG
jgi:PAS domain S-box-containing protein